MADDQFVMFLATNMSEAADDVKFSPEMVHRHFSFQRRCRFMTSLFLSLVRLFLIFFTRALLPCFDPSRSLVISLLLSFSSLTFVRVAQGS